MQNTIVRYDTASPGSRLAARLIDVGIVIVGLFMTSIFIVFLDSIGQETGIIESIFYPLAAIIFLGYIVLQCVLLSVHGQTVGKKFLKIKIVKQTTGENGGFVTNVLLRAFVNGLIGTFVPFYGFVDVMFIFGAERRCIHDMIAGTVVVDTTMPRILENGDETLGKFRLDLEKHPERPDESYPSPQMPTANNDLYGYQPVHTAPVQRRDNKTVIIICVVIGAIMLAAGAFAIISFSTFGDVLQRAKEKAAQQSYDEKFVSSKGDFTLYATKQWTRDDKAERAFAVSLVMTRKYGQSMIKVEAEAISEDVKIDSELMTRVFADIAKTSGFEFDETSIKTIDINGYTAYQTEYGKKVDGEKLKNLYTILLAAPDKIYHVQAITSEDMYSTYKQEIEKIIHTFTLNDAN